MVEAVEEKDLDIGLLIRLKRCSLEGCDKAEGLELKEEAVVRRI
jgi:hypothetical protein